MDTKTGVLVIPPPRKSRWPAAKTEWRKPESLIPYARNARTHTDWQIAQIAGSIREWGWTTPILVDEADTVLAGHARVMAAMKLDLPEVPVIVARGWSEAQKKAYVLADNQLALNAGWDMEMLKTELSELKEWDFDLELLGFDNLDALLASTTEGLTDPDDVPETPAEPISKPGDLWVLGKHRLLCGDATVATDVERLLAGVMPLLMVTDPPYGVEYDADWRNRADRANGKPYGARAVGTVNNDERADWREAWALFPGDVAYVWSSDRCAQETVASIMACGFEIRQQLIWAKARFVISRGDYHPQHEPCWYAVRKGKTGHWTGDRSQSTLWEITHQKSETGHSAQKPVECMRRPIVNNSSPGQAIYDPFLGSGTTMIAAEMTGRACYGLEIDPRYCDVVVKRWQEFTGHEATLEGAGTFDEMATARKVRAA